MSEGLAGAATGRFGGRSLRIEMVNVVDDTLDVCDGVRWVNCSPGSLKHR